jgi:phosphatidylglycerol lysyltransferase
MKAAGTGGARRRAWIVGATALVTLGSGLLNLFSVMDDPLVPVRRELLRQIFPMEFLRLSRSVTLLIGLALVVSSINIYRRKRRAYLSVMALACLSVLFHLTKGLDYEEAVAAIVLAGVLWATRHWYTVKSGQLGFRMALASLSLAAGAALVYGIAGFWLLDVRQFGINFNMADSIRTTMLFLSLAGDPSIVPHTRYARWFLDSLYLMSFSVIGYAGLTLFRPVAHRLILHPYEVARATVSVTKHGRSSQDYFKLWPDKSYLFSPSGNAFVAYGVANGCGVALGDPVGPESEIAAVVRDFAELCRENGWLCGFHQVLPDFLPVYRSMGFRKMKIGDDAIVDLTRFSLEGRSMRSFRIALRKLENRKVGLREYKPPVSDEVLKQAREVSDEWLTIPGRRERQFTLGHFDEAYLRQTPLVAAVDAGGRMLAFTNVIPSYRPGETTCDLIRRRIDAPNGIMDYLFIQVFLRGKARGMERFNLGLAPMSGFQEHEEASPEERAVHLFFQRLNFLFSYRGLRAYKAKFATSWEPRYTIYRNVLELPRIALALGKLSEFTG